MHLSYFLPIIGKPFLSMALVVSVNLLNVALDILFISGFSMGCEGAAAATLVSYLAVFAAAILVWRVKNIVNTISRDGVPALTSMFRYYKKRMPSGTIVYRGLEVITEMNESARSLVEYAFKVVRALGITDGPVHGEFMIDKNGPVLIEANCRVMGGSVPAGFLDMVFGHHETDVVLDSMLDPAFHRNFMRRPYRALRKGYAKDFYSASDRRITASGIIPILLHMKSYYSGWIENAGRTDLLHETIDLETETGCIYLVHDDAETVKKEFDFLMHIEEKYPELLHSAVPLFLPPEDPSELTPEIRRILAADTEALIHDILSYYKKTVRPENRRCLYNWRSQMRIIAR